MTTQVDPDAVDAPRDLAEWSLHCFCLKARLTPHRVVEMDTNGRILFEAVGGVLIDELRRRGIAVTDSQLALLADYGLIDRDRHVIETRFPVLGPTEVTVVRSRTRTIAQGLLANVSGMVLDLVGKLASRGLEQSGYAVVFGHALDGVVWDLLRAREMLPPLELTVETPFWRGSFWACFPGRQGSAGTNEIRENETTLVLVWNDEMAERLAAFSSEPGLRPLLRSIDQTAIGASFAPVTGADRLVPVIHPVESDPIHAACLDVAQVVADAIPDGVGCQDLLEEAEVAASTEDASVIVTHELIWDLAELLAESGTLVPPPAGHSVTPWVYLTSQ